MTWFPITHLLNILTATGCAGFLRQFMCLPFSVSNTVLPSYRESLWVSILRPLISVGVL